MVVGVHWRSNMATLDGEGPRSGPLVVHIRHETGRPGWVRLTTEVARETTRPHHALVKLEDLKR
jgi:hypothetical protein